MFDFDTIVLAVLSGTVLYLVLSHFSLVSRVWKLTTKISNLETRLYVLASVYCKYADALEKIADEMEQKDLEGKS